VKLCVKCAWYGGVALQDGKPICNEPRNDYTSLVDGFPLKFDCSYQRLWGGEGRCGPDGKWWKEKE
jgi:hypothetical protein